MPDSEIIALIAALDEADPEIRRIAVMQAADGVHEHPDLFARASRDLDAGVRLEAVKTLEGDASAEGINALVDRLDDEDEEIRGAAAESLAEILDEAAGPVLLARLPGVTGPARAAVLAALRKLRQPGALAPAIALLGDPLALVRREAVRVLGYLRDANALEHLAERVFHDQDAEVRRAALGALGFGGDDLVVSALVQGLTDEDWQNREEAAVTLAKLLPPGAEAGLIAALDDDYWQVRLKSAHVLGKLKSAAAVPGLIAALSHPIGNLRKEAAGALGAIGDRAAVPALTAALGDQDVEVRKVAQRALDALA